MFKKYIYFRITFFYLACVIIQESVRVSVQCTEIYRRQIKRYFVMSFNFIF